MNPQPTQKRLTPSSRELRRKSMMVWWGAWPRPLKAFVEKFDKDIIKQRVYTAQAIYGQMVFESLANTAESAASLDGWCHKDLSLLARTVCDEVTTMLNQIEEGAPWPRSATHARVVYLEKDGAAIGEVMSYRPLTITPPIYRCWATMRLATLEEWIGSWPLHEMYAGIPEMEVVDAWHKALTSIEQLKLNGKPFCGGVADVASIFDQVRGGLVYKMAAAAGIPPMVLRAYKAYIENLFL